MRLCSVSILLRIALGKFLHVSTEQIQSTVASTGFSSQVQTPARSASLVVI